MLKQALRAEGLRLPSTDADDEAAVALWQQLTRWSGNRSRAELMVDIGLGRKIAIIVAKRLATMMGERGIQNGLDFRGIGLLLPFGVCASLLAVQGHRFPSVSSGRRASPGAAP